MLIGLLQATTIYVDNTLSGNILDGKYSIANRDNSGSDGNAYTTIEAGLNACQPGDIAYVRAGIYHQRADIRVNGQKDNRVTLAGYPGETATMEGTKALAGWEQCTSDDPHLTVQGTVNPNYASIYRCKLVALPDQEYTGTT
jgi:hypothetical protein